MADLSNYVSSGSSVPLEQQADRLLIRQAQRCLEIARTAEAARDAALGQARVNVKTAGEALELCQRLLEENAALRSELDTARELLSRVGVK